MTAETPGAPAADPGPPPATPSAFWPTVLLGAWLAGAKLVGWGLPELGWDQVEDWFREVAVLTHEDLLFALGSGLCFQALLWLARRHPRLRRAAWRLLLAWGAACAAFAAASVHVFAYLRAPLTYPLLYLAGDFSSMRSSLGAFVGPAFVAGLLLAPATWLAACWAARRWLEGWPRRWSARRRGGVLAALALALGGEIAWARSYALGPWQDRADHLVAASPHAAFLGSCLGVALGLNARALEVPFGPGDMADFELPVQRPKAARRPLPGKPPRNVILLVLESTGARYLQVYGSKYATTPNLAAEARHTLAFDNFYCHVGLTSNSMAAITLSVFPYMTWREYTIEYPRLPGRTLADVFKAQGYRTAFLHTGDLDYVNQRGFLTGRGFDELVDFRSMQAPERLSSWGGEDRHLVDALFRFVDQDRQRPFYAMAWTIQSHHPYDPSPDRPFVDFFGKDLPPDDYDLGRYLNTILEVDRQLGRLFAGLRERKLAEDTLVVITGDHGESFGFPHESWGHGAKVYEEGVRVPFLIWSPRLVKQGKHLATIGSHVDVNATVTDLLGLRPDDAWHGRSMFDPGRPPRAYFYAANNDYLLGVREGDFKYVYNLTAGREELYDLKADPEEQRNVAELHPLKCSQLRARVAAWRAHEGLHVQALREAMPPEPPARPSED